MKNRTIRTSIGLIHIGEREKSGLQIAQKLNQYNFIVKEWDVINGTDTVENIDKVDVIVINIGVAGFEFDDLLLSLFEKDKKVIINEAVLTNQLTGVKRQSWERHLLNKIDPVFSLMPNNQELSKQLIDFNEFGIKKIWVLAASIGGPEAIQKFIAEFQNQEGILFIIVQHIDKEFIPLMVSQLNKKTNLDVVIPISGMKVLPNICYVYPTDEYLYFNQHGTLELIPMHEKFTFSPCIDESCKRLSENIKNLNIAFFSGMSSDGIAAAKFIKNKGNKVITQTQSSCILSSIIAGVKESVDIDFDGTPSEMAQYIIENLNE